MGISAACLVLAAMVYGGSGTAKKPGIEEFWTDDYKVFQQVYGKTSDKELYGTFLPTSIIDNGDKKKEASEKRERYVTNYNDPDSIEFDPDYDDNYNKNKNNRKKPAKSSVSFINHSKFKPISQASDPQVYSYLKHLEDFDKEQSNHHKSTGGFKPYLNYGGTSSEETDAYKSIQDIIEAHERNKRKSSKNKDDNMRYLKYLENKKKYPSRSHEISKHRCTGSRCRKTGHGHRSRRPYRRAPTLKKVVVI